MSSDTIASARILVITLKRLVAGVYQLKIEACQIA